MLQSSLKIQDFKLICRTCLQNTVVLTPISDSDAGNMLNYCDFYHMNENDSFPDKICKECLHLLEICYKFKQQCESARYTLEKVLNCELNNQQYEQVLQIDSKETGGQIAILEIKHIRHCLDLNETTNNSLQSFVENNLEDNNCEDSKDDRSEIDEDFISFLDDPLPKQSSNHPCTKCKESFTVQQDLNVHLSIHIGKGLVCNACSKSFTTRKMLKRHIKTHMVRKSHVCEHCAKGFSESYALTKHLRHHLGIPRAKKHFCAECGQGFAEPYYLNLHLRKHTGERPLLCIECNKSFSDPRSLKTHKLTHTGEKPHKCTFCDKSFNQKVNLTKHTRIHTGEKPYLCKACGKRFSQSSSLDKHHRTHSGEKPFGCDVCSRRFTEKSNLKNHLKTHDDLKEKLHSCAHCLSAFKTFPELTAHGAKHMASDKPFQCLTCFKEFSHKNSLRKHARGHGDQILNNLGVGEGEVSRGSTSTIFNAAY